VIRCTLAGCSKQAWVYLQAHTQRIVREKKHKREESKRERNKGEIKEKIGLNKSFNLMYLSILIINSL
jgi:hypothetical protein